MTHSYAQQHWLWPWQAAASIGNFNLYNFTNRNDEPSQFAHTHAIVTDSIHFHHSTHSLYSSSKMVDFLDCAHRASLHKKIQLKSLLNDPKMHAFDIHCISMYCNSLGILRYCAFSFSSSRQTRERRWSVRKSEWNSISEAIYELTIWDLKERRLAWRTKKNRILCEFAAQSPHFLHTVLRSDGDPGSDPLIFFKYAWMLMLFSINLRIFLDKVHAFCAWIIHLILVFVWVCVCVSLRLHTWNW